MSADWFVGLNIHSSCYTKWKSFRKSKFYKTMCRYYKNISLSKTYNAERPTYTLTLHEFQIEFNRISRYVFTRIISEPVLYKIQDLINPKHVLLASYIVSTMEIFLPCCVENV